MQESRDLINPAKLVGTIAKPRMSISLCISAVLHILLIAVTSIAFVGQCVKYKTTHPKVAIQKEAKELERKQKEEKEQKAYEEARRKAGEQQKAESEKKAADAAAAKAQQKTPAPAAQPAAADLPKTETPSANEGKQQTKAPAGASDKKNDASTSDSVGAPGAMSFD